MNVHEYQAKQLLKGFGVPVALGNPAFTPEEAVKAAQDAYREEERKLLAEVLEGGRRSGDFEVGDVEVTVRVLLLAYASFAPPWIFKMDQKKLGADIGAMHGLVLNGLLRRAGGKKRTP